MRVLVACEFSGIVRDAFAAKGHDAWSCDLLPSERPGNHIQGDVLEVLENGWDLMIAFPPCDHLSKAGGAHWRKPEKKALQKLALKFVHDLMDAAIEQIAIENPVGKINTAIRRPDQRIQPYQFGDAWTKETCLWLKNLPPLRSTRLVAPEGNWVKPGNDRPKRRFNSIPEGAGGKKRNRSLTFLGIAQAMADQWGNL
jgi:site-specific DNA-cytosine methylase